MEKDPVGIWKLNLLSKGNSFLETVKLLKVNYEIGIKEAKELCDDVPLIIDIEINQALMDNLEFDLVKNENEFTFIKK